MMTKKTLAKTYQIHHQKGKRYDFGLYGRERGKFFSESIGQGKKVLDLGCRDGSLTQHYLKGNRVIGVDVDRDALHQAKEKYGLETIWLDLNSEWKELEQYRFDIVVMGEVLEHLYFPKKVLTKTYYLLKPGGFLIGSVPNAFRLPSKLRFLLDQKKGTSLGDPTHINHFSHKELMEILNETGFKNVLLEPIVKKRYLWFEKIWPGSFSYLIMFKAQK